MEQVHQLVTPFVKLTVDENFAKKVKFCEMLDDASDVDGLQDSRDYALSVATVDVKNELEVHFVLFAHVSLSFFLSFLYVHTLRVS